MISLSEHFRFSFISTHKRKEKKNRLPEIGKEFKKNMQAAKMGSIAFGECLDNEIHLTCKGQILQETIVPCTKY